MCPKFPYGGAKISRAQSFNRCLTRPPLFRTGGVGCTSWSPSAFSRSRSDRRPSSTWRFSSWHSSSLNPSKPTRMASERAVYWTIHTASRWTICTTVRHVHMQQHTRARTHTTDQPTTYTQNIHTAHTQYTDKTNTQHTCAGTYTHTHTCDCIVCTQISSKTRKPTKKTSNLVCNMANVCNWVPYGSAIGSCVFSGDVGREAAERHPTSNNPKPHQMLCSRQRPP